MASVTDYKLACGAYSVMIMERCGARFKCVVDGFTDLTFNRTLNDVSMATVKVAMRGACCACLAEVNPWQHELAIFRNTELVWIGPIQRIKFDIDAENATIEAKDLFAWADHRLLELTEDYDVEGIDLADGFVWLLNEAYCKQPWCMTWNVDGVNIPYDQFYPAFDPVNERWGGLYLNIGSELRRLSQAGVDWTVVNRHMWGGNVEISNPATSGIMLQDRHFRKPPTITVDGSSMVTRQVSTNGVNGNDGWDESDMWIYPSPPYGRITPAKINNNDAQGIYGLLETLTTTSETYDDVDTGTLAAPIPIQALSQDAKTRVQLLGEPYVSISGGTLDQEAPISFNDHLIPGAIFEVALTDTCRKLSLTISDFQMRLKKVNVNVTGDEESIDIELQPVGTSGLIAS